ncbi:GLUG motif-containing protein, partial [Klebsiella pneumoniae]|uniref:GLUG motif-containing protein n=1 Tax=Klebsiella pneumoniae TaxID=573 RepID=UPI00148F197B
KLIANHQDSNKNDTGGIVGNITGNSSRVNKVRIDALISTNARNNNQTAGGIVGRLENGALISNSVATGEIRNGQGYSRVGGIVGSTWQNSRVN